HRTGVRCAGAVAHRHHSVPLGALVGLRHETWLRTNVAQGTVISRMVWPSRSMLVPPPRDRSSRAGRISRLAPTGCPRAPVLAQNTTRAHSEHSKTRRSNASQGGHSEPSPPFPSVTPSATP